MSELKAIIEALIFASPEPVTVKTLTKLLDGETVEDINAAIDELKENYERPGGLRIVEVAGGYQIVTRSELHEWVRRLFHERTTQKLSVASLEALAVVAYKQPVTAPEIAEIRGVSAAGVVSTLVERKLVKIVGRKQVVGRPFLYGTTREFLNSFSAHVLICRRSRTSRNSWGFDLPICLAKLRRRTNCRSTERTTRSIDCRAQSVMRLNKLLSFAGVASRRVADDLIRQGRVEINGHVVDKLGTQADPEKDDIKVDGRRIKKQAPERRYLLLYKPRGVVSTRSDPEQRMTVIDVLNKAGIRGYFYPVGRLDYDSEGLLIMTNDGAFAERVTHPRYELERTYEVDVEGTPEERDSNGCARVLRSMVGERCLPR